MTTEELTLSREIASALLYVESCCVDYGGTLEGRCMNEADHTSLVALAATGHLTYGRILARYLGTFKRGVTHWAELTESGWELAHKARRARAASDRSNTYIIAVTESKAK